MNSVGFSEIEKTLNGIKMLHSTGIRRHLMGTVGGMEDVMKLQIFGVLVEA